MNITDATAGLGSGPLTEAGLRQHIFPLFSRHRAARGHEIYLANHSLGRPLDQTADDVAEGLAAWYDAMDEAWGPWMSELESFRTSVAALIDADSSDAIVPKASVGQSLRAVLNALPDRPDGRPHRIIATMNEFDSIDFILKAYQDRRRIVVDWVHAQPEAGGVGLLSTDEVVAAITGDTDLVVVSQVFFGTGQVLQGVEKIVDAAHRHGALVFVDSYHAAGVLPISVGQADFMAGGSYKYTRGGPGACWLAIHPRIRMNQDVTTLDTGWFAKEAPFGYARPEAAVRQSGGNAWLESTPAILPLYQARAGLALTLGIGVTRIREYGLSQNEMLLSALEQRNLPVFRPIALSEFGGYVLLRDPNASELANKLKERGVNVDARGGAVRFGPDLLTTEEEIERAAHVTQACLS